MRAIFIFCLCLIATSCYAGEWIVDTTTGCKVWFEHAAPDPNKSISWSGKCEGGIANGQGVLRIYKNKSVAQGSSQPVKIFEGVLKNGTPNGNGTFTNKEGIKYIGEWKDGAPNGKGTMTWANGNKYVGEWKDGKKNGEGTLNEGRFLTYVGGWKNDMKDGKGTLTAVNGNKYVGGWKDDKEDGKGTLTLNGTKYVGDFKDGKRNGEGTLIWADGTKYVGDFKDDNPKGKEIQPLTHSISEEDACNMAIDYFNKHEKQGMMCGNKRMPDDKIAGSCKDFLSNSEQGWAKISVPFEAFGCYPGQEHMHGTSPFTFQRFDQGWMITR